MHTDFNYHLTNRCKVNTNNTILVALSGGADSICLLHLLLTNKYKIYAAHCNFKLRGADADADEKFVINFCKKFNIKLFTTSFDTKKYAAKNKISIEMAARELRYNWFDNLMQDNNIDLLATGHHQDDSIETFFLNLTRGTGIKGLTGLKPKANNIIKPLLCFSRKQIEDYCNNNNLKFCTDSTNAKTIYYRNKIRNIIIPIFKEMNPSFSNTMLNNMEHISQVSSFLNNHINSLKENIITKKENQHILNIPEILKQNNPKLILFELLNNYDFNSATINSVFNCINNNESGKTFYNNTFRLITDREKIIITKSQQNNNSKNYIIYNINDINNLPISLEINNIDANNYTIKKDKNIAQFDADKIKFPLELRHWKKGDSFIPLGMKQKKKLSDFFIDNKFSIIEKEKIWLLCSDNKIIWIVGHRTDDRFKITNKTDKVLLIVKTM